MEAVRAQWKLSFRFEKLFFLFSVLIIYKCRSRPIKLLNIINCQPLSFCFTSHYRVVILSALHYSAWLLQEDLSNDKLMSLSLCHLDENPPRCSVCDTYSVTLSCVCTVPLIMSRLWHHNAYFFAALPGLRSQHQVWGITMFSAPLVKFKRYLELSVPCKVVHI